MSETPAIENPSDEELLAGFEDTTLPLSMWGHREHLRVAFLYARDHDVQAAITLMRDGLVRYTEAHDVPQTRDSGYHETVTVAWMRILSAAARGIRDVHSERFLAERPELLDKYYLLRFYSRERIMSPEARYGYVEPDLEGLRGDEG